MLPDHVGDPGNIWWVATTALAADPAMQAVYAVLSPMMGALLADADHTVNS